jgi:hypothetical protein
MISSWSLAQRFDADKLELTGEPFPVVEQVLYNAGTGLKGPTNFDMWLMPLEGERTQSPLLQTNFAELYGQFSTDGQWIAYMSNESGQWEVYVQSFPGPGGKWQVSNGGGASPKWRRDAKELFYQGADGKLMAVEVKGDSATFEAGVPRPLFDLKLGGLFPGLDRYAVTGDGKRFLVNTVSDESSALPFTVVLNWTTDPKR